uniref:Uridine-cytidine kinase n=1 Tax=Catharus ustulatus TaxID=91951 RepID=A0A8C3U304_CATUS
MEAGLGRGRKSRDQAPSGGRGGAGSGPGRSRSRIRGRDRSGAGAVPPPLPAGLCGGSASGKTTVATRIIEALDVPWVVLLSMDSFYKVLDEGQQALAARSDYNFDHPDAFDFELLVSVLRKLKKGKSVKVPVYDFTTHSRRREWVGKTVYGANVIVFEGILAFANKELLKLLDMKVFVDTDSDIRLVRRLQRDIMERGRDVAGVIKQYNKFVKPAFEQYIEPTVQVADIVVPRGEGRAQPAVGSGCSGAGLGQHPPHPPPLLQSQVGRTLWHWTSLCSTCTASWRR